MKNDPSKFEVEGRVIDALRNATFKVKLENETIIDCHISGKIRKNSINILIGDTVVVEMSKYDLSKGRIVFRKKGGNKNA